MTYCTASAASSTPSRRDSTTLPVVPSSLAIGAASANTTKHSASTAAITAEQDRQPHRIAAAAAGQQHGGGDRAGARHQRNGEREGGDVAHVLLDRLLGLAFDCRSMRTPNTISDAIENSSSPPAMRNAGSVIDNVRSSQSPTSALPARIAAAIRQARSATLRRARFRQAVRDPDEGRHQADRIDHDDQRDQSGDEEFERHGFGGRYALAVGMACAKWRAKTAAERLPQGPPRAL